MLALLAALCFLLLMFMPALGPISLLALGLLLLALHFVVPVGVPWRRPTT